MANCLLCGAGVWYVGLFNADCTNAGCTNYREQPRVVEKKPEYGTWAWAKKMQRQGWKLEWRHSSHKEWTALTERLDDDPETAESEPYAYRLNQEVYECKSKYPRGSGAWAIDQEISGGKYRFNGQEYEIIP
jgi:hypothetical protein